MIAIFGWCVLRSSRAPYEAATFDSVDEVDECVDAADRALWTAFRRWMDDQGTQITQWQLVEELNNVRGVLTFIESRNHRAPIAFDMMRWIVENGPGSYGLFYVHDDEDNLDSKRFERGKQDFTNVFRVHRIANREVSELSDPFLSPIVPFLNPNDLA